MQDRYMPGYSLPTKSYPVQNEKRFFLLQMPQRDINRNGSVYDDFGRKPSIASVNKKYSTF